MDKEYVSEALVDELTSFAGLSIKEIRMVPEGFERLFKEEDRARGLPSEIVFGSGEEHMVRITQVPGELFDGFTEMEYWHRPMTNPAMDPNYLRKQGQLRWDWEYRQKKIANTYYAGVREMVIAKDSMKKFLLPTGQELNGPLMCGKVVVHEGDYKPNEVIAKEKMNEWESQLVKAM